MNWSCEQVVHWVKSFIDDDSILSRFEGQLVLFIIEMHVLFSLIKTCYKSLFLLNISLCMLESYVWYNIFRNVYGHLFPGQPFCYVFF